VLRIEAAGHPRRARRLDASFEKRDVLFAATAARGTGMENRLIGRKISATLSSTELRPFSLHAAEALHGTWALARGDAILAVSYGGETEEIVRLLEALSGRNALII